MHRTAARLALGFVLAFAFIGCRSHKAKVADLQKQYDRLGKQYGKDCESELINVPPKLSPKCAAEKQKLADTWNRLQAERAKQ